MQGINPPNKVFIIGGDHHNGLGLARIFGLNGIKVHAIVISEKKRSWMASSKYVASKAIFKTEKEAFDYLLKNFSNETDKPFIIPYSDGAAMELDLRLNQFKDIFYVPSINGEQGRIAALMNKDAQYKWACEHGIKMAQSAVIDCFFDDCLKNICEKFNFPCILKPNNSANGSKLDIVVCDNYASLKTAVEKYKSNGYRFAIVQEYLSIDYEIDVLGGIANGRISSIFPHKIIRRWPKGTGTSSFTQVLVDENSIFNSKKILSNLVEDGFNGLYDMELFKVGNEYYLNEINFRNSGSCFRTIKQKFYYAYKWFCETVKCESPECTVPQDDCFSMTEYTDFRHVLKGNVSFKHWISDFLRCRNFSILNLRDFLPILYKILYRIM